MGIGLLATAFRPIMIVYFLVAVVYFLSRILTLKNKQREVLIASAYMVGAEVFFRMTKAYFLYETGKYMVIAFLSIGMFYHGFKRKSFVYFIYILLLIPGIYVSFLDSEFDARFRQNILFNLSGPLCLAIASIYCYGRSIKLKELYTILNFLVYPIISMTIYVYFYNIDVREVVTGTASTSATSGGFGPNQVSTMLGLGAFVLYTRFLLPYKNKLVHLFMMFFLMAFVHRAIITFSRGGVLTAAIMVVAFTVIIFLFSRRILKLKLWYRIITVAGILLAIWSFSVLQTGGLIANRYSNRDALGREKEDVTTGRSELLNADFQAFAKNPVFGIGVGRVRYFYEAEVGVYVASHNEITRLFSEHGVFGIISLVLLLFVPFLSKIQGQKNIYFYPFIIFWLLTIAHSSMRIAAPAFIYGLSLLNIEYTNEKKPTVHRQQAIKEG